MIGFSQSVHRLPTPFSGTNQTVFSETRALQLLNRLSSEIGVREVGMKSNEIDTPQYLMNVIQSLMSVAEKNGWKLEVELEAESGALSYYFVHTQFTNVYLNITNVVISLTLTMYWKIELSQMGFLLFSLVLIMIVHFVLLPLAMTECLLS